MILRGRLRHAHQPGLCRGGLCRLLHRAAGRRPPGRVYRPGRRAGCDDAIVPQAGDAREAEPGSWRRSPAATTSSTARCGSTMCSSRGSGCSRSTRRPRRSRAGCAWHHLYGWLAKAEFTLGIALALTDAMGLKQHDMTVDYLVDVIAEVQVVRSCIAGAEHDPDFTAERVLRAEPRASRRGGGITSLFKSRQRISELLRIIARLVAGGGARRQRPRDPRAGAGPGRKLRRRRLHRAAACRATPARLGSRLVGIGWARVGVRGARQRRHAGLAPLAQAQLLCDYNQLANAVLDFIDLDMPAIDVSGIGTAPIAARRAVSLLPDNPAKK